jgi:hypothetical protein
MHIFALFPLSVYFFCLFRLNRQRHPAVLDSSTDFQLLAVGLFGFMTLGPAKMLIPLQLMTFWGAFVWLFWTAFYFAAARTIGQRLPNSLIIYHCPRQVFVPELLNHLRTLDAEVRQSGNVLLLPGQRIQCLITGGRFGGYTLLQPAEPAAEPKAWNEFAAAVKTFCGTAESPKSNAGLLWGFLAAATAAGIAATLFLNGGQIVRDIADLWI